MQYNEECCKNQDIKYVILGKQLRQQCFNCGKMNSSAIKKDTVSDLSKIPMANTELRDKYYEKTIEENRKFSTWINEKRDTLLSEQYSEYLQSEKWKTLRAKILKRDNYICKSCLVNEAVQVHHLTYARLYDECAFDLVSVCIECHKKIHNK